MFVKDASAMKIGNFLAVTDLHLGITRDLWTAGVSMPSQAGGIAETLNALSEQTRTDCLILAGDLKHKLPVASKQEKREIPDFLDRLNFSRVILTKGNHDGWIEKLVGDRVEVVDVFEHRGYCFTHGHMNVKTDSGRIVVGHNHPHVRFRDELGAMYWEPVWVRGPLSGSYEGKEIIIMPSFNTLCGAYAVTEGFMGPVAKHVTCEANVYLLDGTDLGAIKDLPKSD